MLHYIILGTGILFLATNVILYGKSMLKLISASATSSKNEKNIALVKKMEFFLGFVAQNAYSQVLVAYLVAFWPWLRIHAPFQLTVTWIVASLVAAVGSVQFKH